VSTATGSRPFDICGPLPGAGVTVLEASAGTGKTFTIAALATRYVAEGTPLSKVLLVTFTRMATGELRERVRERIVSAEHALATGAASDDRDEVVALLAAGPAEEVERRRRNLAEALADFDAATIVTTHSFCQEVLGSLGIAGDVDREFTFVEDPSDLIAEVVDDLYVRKFMGEQQPAFDRAHALDIVRTAVSNPSVPIEPHAAPPGSLPALRRSLAVNARVEFNRRKLRGSVMTYDDLLTTLDEVLVKSGGGEVAERLRRQWPVVLVDEFQDTDPVQWDILRRAFAEGGGTLVLIGDPKQAIYSFRGADVYAYLKAVEAARTVHRLDVNWRSDQPLIDAYDAVFGGARLGHEGIAYGTVKAAAANQAPRLLGAPESAALRLRVVDRADLPGPLVQGGCASLPQARAHIARDLAADVVRLLSSRAEIETRSEDGAVTGRERISPGHVAVLVRTNRSAAEIRDALEAVDVPAVINGAGSVFETEPAGDWLVLLEAIERPSSEARARKAALTPFLGWTAERVACASDAEWEEVHARLHRWARVLRVSGVASLAETVTLAEGLPRRVLVATDGERRLTDLRHAGQLLHAAATAEQMGPPALTAWLRRRIAAARDETSDEEMSRRLESDAQAVQVLTIHRSKGLEFPVVYCPSLWEVAREMRRPEPVAFHDPDHGDQRTIDVGLEGADYARHRAQSIAEKRGEDLRLAYVALTRARHQAVVWWAGSKDSRNSPLGRLLFAREGDGTVPENGRFTPSDAAATSRFEELARTAPGCIAVERARLSAPEPWAGEARAEGRLEAASFSRTLDWWWRRTSYSDITSGAHEARVASEPERPVVWDEPEGEAPVAAPDSGDAEGLRAVPSLLAAMPAGVHVGTFVHRVLEAADFAAEDLGAELGLHAREALARRALEVGDVDVAVAGLRAALETPLGPVLGGSPLAGVARSDRLDELDFELPLVGGDEPAGELKLEAIGTALRRDPALATYADRLEDPALRSAVRGYLTGSIDLVVRQGERFAIADYKTNWLGAPGEELTSWHYRPAALAAEMERSHYVLQALLYTVALHRYLRWRLPGYDPDRNLAGVLYLFLRGMSGPQTPVVDGSPCGVFAWRPSGALVRELSDVLDRGGA
jgi:exodeoxyribonuclease V beta subunit